MSTRRKGRRETRKDEPPDTRPVFGRYLRVTRDGVVWGWCGRWRVWVRLTVERWLATDEIALPGGGFEVRSVPAVKYTPSRPCNGSIVYRVGELVRHAWGEEGGAK